MMTRGRASSVAIRRSRFSLRGRRRRSRRPTGAWKVAYADCANNARKVLETNGLRENQIKRVISYADSEPLAPENPLADENRRLSILAERQNPAPAKTEPGIEAPIVQPADVPAAASPSG